MGEQEKVPSLGWSMGYREGFLMETTLTPRPEVGGDEGRDGRRGVLGKHNWFNKAGVSVMRAVKLERWKLGPGPMRHGKGVCELISTGENCEPEEGLSAVAFFLPCLQHSHPWSLMLSRGPQIGSNAIDHGINEWMPLKVWFVFQRAIVPEHRRMKLKSCNYEGVLVRSAKFIGEETKAKFTHGISDFSRERGVVGSWVPFRELLS